MSYVPYVPREDSYGFVPGFERIEQFARVAVFGMPCDFREPVREFAMSDGLSVSNFPFEIFGPLGVRPVA